MLLKVYRSLKRHPVEIGMRKTRREAVQSVDSQLDSCRQCSDKGSNVTLGMLLPSFNHSFLIHKRHLTHLISHKAWCEDKMS